MKITFLGATREVTGSRYFIETDDIKLLVDCGLFQGKRELTRRNWDPFPIDPSSIDAIVLTHAHIDHTGYIPVLTQQGFHGAIYCSKPTYELCKILLVDSAHLQEDFAAQKSKYHRVFPPLYTVGDVEKSLKLFNIVEYDTPLSLGNLTITFIRAGHILGSSFIIISDGKRTLTFSGDLGRPEQFILKAPPPLEQTDFLVLDSTYGDRLHASEDPIHVLKKVVNKTVAKGGKLIIPAFAVGRTQTLLYCLYQLKKEKAIPNIPIFLDSPMGIDVTNLLCEFENEHQISPDICKEMFRVATYTPTAEESKKINRIQGPAIIIAGSGMVNGGRVLFHLQRLISDAKNTLLFVGFQGSDTYGRKIVEGVRTITLDGKRYNVRARIETMRVFSGHADYNEILQWLSYFKNTPKMVFLTHGDYEAAQSLQKKIEEKFGWHVIIPKYLDSFALD